VDVEYIYVGISLTCTHIAYTQLYLSSPITSLPPSACINGNYTTSCSVAHLGPNLVLDTETCLLGAGFGIVLGG
jgi:hypothetical protein